MTLTKLGKTIPALAVAALVAAGCSDGTPAVGECTNADPNQLVQLDVKVVGCDDDTATSKIVKEAETAAECDSGRLTFEDEIYCTEPLKK